MSKIRKKFTKEERLEIFKQSFEDDATVIEAAKRFDISANTLSCWRRDFREKHGVKGSKLNCRFLPSKSPRGRTESDNLVCDRVKAEGQGAYFTQPDTPISLDCPPC